MVETDGLSLIVASSEEEEILELSDTVYVFQGGKTVTDGIPVGELSVAKLRELAWSH